jgi:hypothetical protein
MALFDKSDQTLDHKRVGRKTFVHHCKENTAALKKVNNQIRNILNRIPLNTQKEVVEINRLIDEQEKLIRVKIKGNIPVELETLNSNERHRAMYLRRRFNEAQRTRKIRK